MLLWSDGLSFTDPKKSAEKSVELITEKNKKALKVQGRVSRAPLE